MVARYAVIHAGRVQNVIKAEGPIEGLTMVLLGGELRANPGDLWDGAAFTPPTPTPEQVAAQVQEAADAAALEAARADALVQYLVTHTPAEIAANVDAEVTNLAAAKTYIAKLGIAVSVLARKELR